MEGNSILYALTKILVYGRFLPSGGLDVQLNQVAWAAWVGLLVTSLNLIPLGQLDGGHIASVLFGDKAKQLFWPIIISLVILVVVTGTTTWILWVFILFFLGRTYAEPLDQVTELDPRRRADRHPEPVPLSCSSLCLSRCRSLVPERRRANLAGKTLLVIIQVALVP